MFRLFLALNFLLLNLFACKGGYESCKLKIIHSKAINNQSLFIQISKNKKLIFSRKTPNSKILKHDPFLSLYLVEDKKNFKHPFRINNHLSLGMASVDEKIAIEGRIVKKQVGLNSFATFSEPLFTPALLLNSCCALEGIVTSRGIIQKRYIERFLKNDKVSYSDIGIRVKDKNKLVIVNVTNPFIENNPFKNEDCILLFDGKKVKSSASLMQKILFSKVGSLHVVKIKRDNKIKILKVKSFKRVGGGYLSDTFLEFLGISFDKNLFIIKIENKAQKYGLRLGDQLLQINFKNVTNKKDILKKISQSKNSFYLLFEREKFQFFIKLN